MNGTKFLNFLFPLDIINIFNMPSNAQQFGGKMDSQILYSLIQSFIHSFSKYILVPSICQTQL